MLLSLFRSRKAIREAFTKLPGAPQDYLLTDDEWLHVYYLLKVLEPMVLLTFDLQKREFTVSEATIAVLSLINGLKAKIEDEKSILPLIIREVVAKLSSAIQAKDRVKKFLLNPVSHGMISTFFVHKYCKMKHMNDCVVSAGKQDLTRAAILELMEAEDMKQKASAGKQANEQTQADTKAKEVGRWTKYNVSTYFIRFGARFNPAF